MQAINMRRRTSAMWSSSLDTVLGSHSPLSTMLLGSPIFGPQVRVTFHARPGTRSQLAASEVYAEVGQLLAYVRIKQQASMTAFATQISQITQSLAPPGGGGKAAASSGGAGTAAARAGIHHMRRKPAFRLQLMVVGIDLLFRVQSKDLMSIKLQQGRLTMEQRAITSSSGPLRLSHCCCRRFCRLLEGSLWICHMACGVPGCTCCFAHLLPGTTPCLASPPNATSLNSPSCRRPGACSHWLLQAPATCACTWQPPCRMWWCRTCGRPRSTARCWCPLGARATAPWTAPTPPMWMAGG